MHILQFDIDGLVLERRYSITNALELRLPYTNPSIWSSKSEKQSDPTLDG